MPLEDATSTPITQLNPRAATSHKGDYGRVLVVGGSLGMAGAPALAGMAALRSGAGLVTLAIPQCIQATVAGFEPSYMTLGLGSPEESCLGAEEAKTLIDLAAKMTAVALGPGLGVNPSTASLVQELYQQVELPMVVDADALNAIALDIARIKSAGGSRILTPHPGEFQRLSGKPIAGQPADRAAQAAELCRQDPTGQTIVVLKGHQTIVTDGQRYTVNSTGNPGMATGGTGDCLTGVITSFVAQGLSPWNAARLATHVHGLAGDLAAQKLGQVSLIASDLIKHLPVAFEN
ncbi:MAG: NAD(P)H-hydrate dehydratase [Planctomycetes bacterium]|nr:NAD(P)H-hydrate dehydratase [Planctomycetota bacterium]